MVKTAELPLVTVIMPVRNEAAFIEHSLSTVLAQDYPAHLIEVLVVDGMSDDGTREIVCGMMAGALELDNGVDPNGTGTGPSIALVDNFELIVSTGLNTGLQLATGEIIIRVDGHWHVPSDFLSQIVGLFKEHTVDCLGGLIVREVNTETGRAIELARASLLGGGLAMRNDASLEEQVLQDSHVAFIWRRTVFDKVGGFDPRFVRNQDNEFNFRTLRAGLRTLFSPKVVFYYHPPEIFRKLFRQLFGYASYTPMIAIKHHQLVDARLAIPAAGLFLWLLLLVSAVANLAPVIAPLLLLALYACLVTVGGLLVSLRAKKLEYWIAVCIAYITIHTAVSLGYLHGISRLFDVSLVIGLWRDSRTGE